MICDSPVQCMPAEPAALQQREGSRTMKYLKKLTILHSNDMHGDFLAEKVDDRLVGGVSMLSGYVDKVRHECQNVIYAVSGDMFRGSLIDSEYKGISTIEIMNLLSPDVVTLGNHEVDYGIAHLLFIEKCAKFPIINANMYLTTNHARLFKSHVIMEMDGMKILFIGVLTEEVLAQTKQDRLIGSIVDVEEAAREVGKICNAYRTEDIDLTVLLTHIGFESDKKLAAELDPNWGVDLIIGGHSHTRLEEPEVVAGIPIVQAACGTDQIGRFDILVDTESNCVYSYNWQLVPIDEEHCPRDEALEEVILGYKEKTDRKYSRIVTRFADRYTHPQRNRETMLGKLLADAFKDVLGVDIMLLCSGSIRKEALGPIVRYQDLMEMLPYNDSVYRIFVTGAQLRWMIRYILREEAFTGHTEFYQFSRGLRIEYSREKKELISLSCNGYEVRDDQLFKVGIQSFHLNNLKAFLGVTPEEISEYRKPKIISTNCTDVVVEYFSTQELVRASEEHRLVLV